MILGPAEWLRRLMQLTYVGDDFKGFIIVLGMVYFALGWLGEHYVFRRIAGFVGRTKERITRQQKKRKEYKLIQERMLF